MTGEGSPDRPWRPDHVVGLEVDVVHVGGAGADVLGGDVAALQRFDEPAVGAEDGLAVVRAVVGEHHRLAAAQGEAGDGGLVRHAAREAQRVDDRVLLALVVPVPRAAERGAEGGVVDGDEPAVPGRRLVAEDQLLVVVARPAVRRSPSTCDLADALVGIQQLAPDHQALDLGRALVDLGRLGVAHQPLDRVVAHEAVAPEHLHRLRGDPHRRLGAAQLGHRRPARRPLPGVLAARRLVQEGPRRGEPRGHVGQLELDRLEVLDRPAELPALGGVAGGVLQRGAGDPARLGRDPQPPAVERLERVDEAARRVARGGGRRRAAGPGRRAPTVFDARSPILSSGLPATRPGVPAGIDEAPDPPRARARRPPRSVRTIARMTSAVPPLLIHALAPFSTHPSPLRTARARSPAASEPASASESAKAPSSSPRAIGLSQRSCCAALPCRSSICVGSELCTATDTAMDASAAAISSTASR